MTRSYLDWNATAPLRPEARAAMMIALESVGNPSSVHAEGRQARRLVENAREQVAALVGALPKNVVFTSGGTEANMLALTPAIDVDGDRSPRQRLLVSAIEHASVRSGGRFAAADLEEIPVTPHGDVEIVGLTVRLQQLAADGVGRLLVSVQAANNETGVIQRVPEIARLVHECNGLLHVDAVQAPGRIPCDFKAFGCDLLSLSGHKIGAPQGTGALIMREGIHVAPLITGGGQERGYRAGTENVAAIAGFGAAATVLMQEGDTHTDRMRSLRARLETGLQTIAPETVIFGAARERLPNTSLFAIPGVKAETALIALDLDGVAVSSGSACSSGKVAPSHVLAAMGISPELARGAIRISIGHTTTETEIEMFLSTWAKFVANLYKARSNIAA
jgi:cysteine desulfurase